MNRRIPLSDNKQLILGDTTYFITKYLGCGANAMVYLARYRDNLHNELSHTVVMKEMYPFHSKGLIVRNGDGQIECDSQAQEYFKLQRKSFLRGNIVHLELQNIRGDMTSVNINSFEENGTLYTILGNSNGETLKDVVGKGTAFSSLRDITVCITNILDALEVFHKNGLLHLDISPDNILLMPLEENKSEKYRRIMLIDYNSVWSIAELEENEDFYFSMKENYTSPEVRLIDRRSISIASDLFSVCAIFLELLQGEPLDFSILYSHNKIIDTDTKTLINAPVTAVYRVISILKRGLCLSPNLRYQSAAEMRADLEELINRIDGIGITHSALWEVSRKNFQNFAHTKKKYQFLYDKNKLLPCKVSLNNGEAQKPKEVIKSLSQSNSRHGQIVADGGMGKTTAVLMLWKDSVSSYDVNLPVPIYITLYNYKSGASSFIKSCLLEKLKFNNETTTMEDAVRALDQLLDTEIKKGDSNLPSVLLLLDGLNEITGDSRLLLLEIYELMKKAGTQVLLTSRMENHHLKLNRLEILPLADIEVKECLHSHQILYPRDQVLQGILTNPMMLSLYVETCRTENKSIDIHSADELLEKYLNSLLLSYKDQTIGNEKVQMQADYTIYFLLPAIAWQMKKTGTYVLTTNEVYAVVKKCFHLLSDKSFLGAFPQYVGKVKYIKDGANDAEEWFDVTVHQLLANKFSLILRDEYSNYRLIHGNYFGYLWDLHEKNENQISRCRPNREGFFGAITEAVRGIFYKRNINAEDLSSLEYKHAKEEKVLLNNGMTGLADSLAKLGMLLKIDFDTLKLISEKQCCVSSLLKQRAQDSSVFMEDQFLNSRIIAALYESRIPIPIVVLKELLGSTSDYKRISEQMAESLNIVFTDESEYSSNDKEEIVRLFKEYMNSLSTSYFLKLQLVMLHLDEDSRKPLLNALPYIEVFRDKLLTMSIGQSKSEVECLIKAEDTKRKQIKGLIKSFGVWGVTYDKTI